MWLGTYWGRPMLIHSLKLVSFFLLILLWSPSSRSSVLICLIWLYGGDFSTSWNPNWSQTTLTYSLLLLSFQPCCPRGVRNWDVSSSSVIRRTGRTSRLEKCPCSPQWAPWSPASPMGQCSRCCVRRVCVDVSVCVCEQTVQADGKSILS